MSTERMDPALKAVLEAALTVGRHWLDQEGVNAQYLDALALAVRDYDVERSGASPTEQEPDDETNL